jgi:hypothetical protein
MAESLRREDELTTADLAGRREVDRLRRNEIVDDASKPKPVISETLGGREPRASSSFGEQRTTANETAPTPLFADADVNDLRERWSNVQAGFVDEPRRAVEDADKLVAAVMERLAQGFANERSSLERQWSSGDQVSTEDLRLALQRYRSFFDRLLNA